MVSFALLDGIKIFYFQYILSDAFEKQAKIPLCFWKTMKQYNTLWCF